MTGGLANPDGHDDCNSGRIYVYQWVDLKQTLSLWDLGATLYCNATMVFGVGAFNLENRVILAGAYQDDINANGYAFSCTYNTVQSQIGACSPLKVPGTEIAHGFGESSVIGYYTY